MKPSEFPLVLNYIPIFSFYIQPLFLVGVVQGVGKWTFSRHGNLKCGSEHLFFSI
jgi:hypothetical protein